MYTGEHRNKNLGKGVIAGLVGGLIGTIVMTQFQNGWSAASKALRNETAKQPRGRMQETDSEKEDATMKAAEKAAELGGKHLSHEERKKLGPVIHYAFGTLQGAAYGGVTELAGRAGGLVPGLIFGGALFTLADEIAVPALGLSGKPSETPLPSHLYGLAAHIVYGLSTEFARRGLRAAI